MGMSKLKVRTDNFDAGVRWERDRTQPLIRDNDFDAGVRWSLEYASFKGQPGQLENKRRETAFSIRERARGQGEKVRLRRKRRDTLLTELGAIEGLGRIAETLRAHLEDSIPTILQAGLVLDGDPLGAARELAAALGEVLDNLTEATS